MHLTTIDFLVVAAYFALATGIATAFIGKAKWSALAVALGITFTYTVLAGYWGITATHGLQYCFEMGGAIVLAVVSWRAAGGASALTRGLGAAHPAGTAAGTTFG